MKGMDLIEALEDIREDWIEDAMPTGRRRPPNWLKHLSLAACLILMIGFSATLLMRFGAEPQQKAAAPDAASAMPLPASQEEQEQEEQTEEELFYAQFYQLDRQSMEDYITQHPETLEHGWQGIDINAAGLEDGGTELYTGQGDQVLALDARNGILLIRVYLEEDGHSSRGVLAICKNTSALRLCGASSLPDTGETVGEICEENGGLLAMTGSAFLDDGSSDGGQISGLAVCSGVEMGSRLGGYGDKRLELREDDRMYIVDSADDLNPATRDACEFSPALIVDGENVAGNSTWNSPNPRAVLGQSAKLETMMVVVEGRLLDSPGCGVKAVADKLEQYGCVQAMNLDGGTSAIMYYKGKNVTRCSNTELPNGRNMPTAWVYGEKAE